MWILWSRTSVSSSVTDLLKFFIPPGFTFVRSYAFEKFFFSFLLGFQLFGMYIFKVFPNDLLDLGRALQSTDSLLLFLKVSLWVFHLDVYVCNMVDYVCHGRSWPQLSSHTQRRASGRNEHLLPLGPLSLFIPSRLPARGWRGPRWGSLPTSVNTTRIYSERHAQRPIPQGTLESAQLTMALSQR